MLSGTSRMSASSVIHFSPWSLLQFVPFFLILIPSFSILSVKTFLVVFCRIQLFPSTPFGTAETFQGTQEVFVLLKVPCDMSQAFLTYSRKIYFFRRNLTILFRVEIIMHQECSTYCLTAMLAVFMNGEFFTKSQSSGSLMMSTEGLLVNVLPEAVGDEYEEFYYLELACDCVGWLGHPTSVGRAVRKGRLELCYRS